MKSITLINKTSYIVREVFLLSILVALFLWAGTARAEETTVSGDAGNTVSVEKPPARPLPFPLERVKQEIKGILPKNILPPEARDIKERVASTTRAIGEKKVELEKIKEQGVQAREDVKNRLASTSDMVRERVGDVKEKIKEQVASTTDALKARAEERVKAELKRSVGLMTAAIERLETLIGRIESRASKLAGAGADVSGIQTDVETAKTEIAAAKTDLESIRTSSASVLGSTNLAAAAASLQNVRTTLQSARDHIKKAETAVRSAVEKLKVAAGTITTTETPN